MRVYMVDHLNEPLRTEVRDFLNKNLDIFASSVLDLPGCDTLKHEIRLKDEKPVKCKPYRMPYNLRGEMESQLDMLLEAGILVPSNSEFASPVMVVKKADGGYRLAVDFRKLNAQLIKDSYPLPNITETIDSLAGSKYFSTMDLTSIYQTFENQFVQKDQVKCVAASQLL